MVIAGGVAPLQGIARGAPVVIIGGELSKMSYALMGANTFALSQFRSPAYNLMSTLSNRKSSYFPGVNAR
jgi:hypothetical protein